METRNCPLCKALAELHGFSDYLDFHRWRCPGCGEFLINMFQEETLEGLPRMHNDDHLLAKLSAIIKEHTLQKLPPVLLCLGEKPEQFLGAYVATVDELLSKWPKDVIERMDRALCNIALQFPMVGLGIDIAWESYPTFFALNRDEAFGIASALVNDGVLSKEGLTNSGFMGEITPDGWRRIRELQQSRQSCESPAFVAMSFGGDDPEKQAEMRKLYKEGIEPSVRACGYLVDRVDLTQHNEYIMDKIRAMIRVAPFVVADFTGHRDGVYFEAGLAMGQGIPVIACCRECDSDNIHFDTKQLNHIRWTEPGELKERLINRILGTIGQGPHPVEGQEGD